MCHARKSQDLRLVGSTLALAMTLGILGGVLWIPGDQEVRSQVVTVGRMGSLTPGTFRHLWWFYFSLNIRAAAISVALGILGSYAPLVVVGVNGASYGAFLVAVVLLPEARLGATLLTMMPHALIEIPAIVLAVLTGMRIPRASSGMGLEARIHTLFRSWPRIVLLSLMLAVSAGLEVISWTHAQPASAGILPDPWMPHAEK